MSSNEVKHSNKETDDVYAAAVRVMISTMEEVETEHDLCPDCFSRELIVALLALGFCDAREAGVSFDETMKRVGLMVKDGLEMGEAIWTADSNVEKSRFH